MAKLTKQKKVRSLQGEHAATIRAAVALKELLKTKAKMQLLTKRRAFLTKLIIKEGCGTAHGYRSYVAHTPARTYWVHKKASDYLRLIAINGK